MRQVLIRTAVKGVIILIGILLICTILQFMIWVRGPEFIELMLGQISVTDERAYEQVQNYLYRELGLDRPFIPDLWPFDNESLWDKARSESR
jgi:ABC-type dipeptide/oligopeptide/nickel transport system permease component